MIHEPQEARFARWQPVAGRRRPLADFKNIFKVISSLQVARVMPPEEGNLAAVVGYQYSHRFHPLGMV